MYEIQNEANIRTLSSLKEKDWFLYNGTLYKLVEITSKRINCICLGFREESTVKYCWFGASEPIPVVQVQVTDLSILAKLKYV